MPSTTSSSRPIPGRSTPSSILAAFLFGRRTYEIFASSWGTWDDPGESPIWTALNTRPKYVASTTSFDPTWANTTVLSGDVEAAIRALQAEGGGWVRVTG